MKIIKYTYRFRIKPTGNQIVLLNKHFGSVRWTYNYFLNQRKDEYLNNKKTLNYYDQAKELTQIKKLEDKQWLYEINSQTLQYSLKCLDQAYQNFFSKRTKFPKFKSRKNKNVFTISQNTKIKNNKIIIPKFQEGIEMNMERNVEGKIKKCSISRSSTGKYFVSILTEKDYEPIKKSNKSVGIDLGLKDFLVLSDGLKIKNHKFLKHYQRILNKNQHSLSKKVKKSNRYEKKRLRVANIYEKISNSRSDLIHKTTSMIIKNYDVIYLEDLNIKGLSKRYKPKQDENGKYLPNGQSAKSGLNKSILDVAWGQFIDTIEYKAEWNDKKVIKVDRFFPSSKTCSKCGWIKNDLKLKDRVWICPICGEKHDRDLNAAKNILNEGLRLNISDGTSDYGCGDQIRLDLSSIICEASKEMDQLDPETTTSLV